MADELDFGFPATSTRTSSDDFTTTTLTGFADASLDYTDSTHGGDAGPAHAAGGIPRFEGSDGGATAERLHAGHHSGGLSTQAKRATTSAQQTLGLSRRLRRAHGSLARARLGCAGRRSLLAGGVVRVVVE